MKFRLSGGFGELSEVREGVHTGIDIAFPEGTTLRSVSEGIVEGIRDYGTKNIGKGVVIRTPNGEHHIYGHMSEIGVVKGQHISPGEVIGLSGSTGNSTGPHLHFGIQNAKGTFIDPTDYAEPLSEMAGNVSYEHVMEIAKTIGEPSWAMGKLNEFSDWFVGKETEYLLKPLVKLFHDIGAATWHWFIVNLPDIMGYGAVLAGVCIIIGSMLGKGGMLKPLAIYAVALIIAICILGGV